MPDEVTPGEITRRLDGLVELVRDLPTRAETNAINDALRGDIARLNQGMAENKREIAAVDGRSITRHEKAEADSERRIALLEAKMDKRFTAVESEVDENRKAQDALAREQREQRSSKAFSGALAAIAVVGSIIAGVITAVILRGIGAA